MPGLKTHGDEEQIHPPMVWQSGPGASPVDRRCGRSKERKKRGERKKKKERGALRQQREGNT